MFRRASQAFLPIAAISFFSHAVSAEPFDTAVLQGLDKVTARVSTLEAPVGEAVRFGTLEIIARTCDKRPPEEPPESAAFLDIWEVRPGEPATGVFRGWMFSSSPALSALEHGVYDVWVIDCRNTGVVQPSPPDGQAAEGEGQVTEGEVQRDETLPPPEGEEAPAAR
ncbi:MAG: DUF2155 domain-containing protein [Rhodospirillales bacterium]|nr:DUF2155 domain-containing protein [Rhodospirillales bacterium]MCW9001324.1 DUF2155 domain-containing protein [Rhodospirillales bacterium]MCW9040283.1 DUF2155 domain-containing protein [Rhodospirillales bacterium]